MEQQNLPMEMPEANAEKAETAQSLRATGPKEWLSIAFNAALGSAFSVLVFLALYVSARTWGWDDFGKFLLIVALLTLLEMRIIEPLTGLLHIGGRAAQPEKSKVSLRRAIFIALVFTTVLEAFNLIIGGEALKALGQGKEGALVGLQFALVAFVVAFFAVGTVTFCWAWGASMKRRRAGILGLLGGIIVGLCFARFQQHAPEIMATLFNWLGLSVIDWSPLRIMPYEAFAQHVSVWGTSGFVGGLIIDLKDSLKQVELLSFPLIMGFGAVLSFGLLWALAYPVAWLLFGEALYPFQHLQGFVVALASEVETWGIIVRNLGWGIGILACAHSANFLFARKAKP